MVDQSVPALSEDSVDLKKLFLTILHQWKIILTCIILALGLALLYLRVTSPIYVVNGLIEVDDKKNTANALLGDISSFMDVKAPAQTEVEVIKSRLILSRAIKNLNLDILINAKNDSLNNKLTKQLNYKRIYNRQGVQYLNNKGMQLRIIKLAAPLSMLNQALEIHFNSNQQYQIILPNGEVFQANVNQPFVHILPDGILELQFDKAINVQQQTFFITKSAMQTAVDRVNSQLTAAEKGKLTGIINISYKGTDRIQITQTLNEILAVYTEHNISRKSAETQNTLEFLGKQLPELKKQLEESENRFNAFREKNNTVDVTKESELLIAQNVDLETKRLELEQKKAELGGKFTQDFPLMKQVTDQLITIADKTNELNERLNQLPEIQRQYLQLYRDVQINTELYTALQNSYQQLKVVKAGQIGNVYVLDNALIPLNPVQPKSIMVLLLSIFLGGFAGVLIALLRNIFTTGVKDTAEIEEKTGLPVYATVPHSPVMDKVKRNKTTLPLLALQDSEDISIESLRSVRTVLHFSQASAKNNLILITGPSPEIGKSFIASNLATILTQTGKRVLLIDADMRRGYLHKYFNGCKSLGLSDYVADSTTHIADVLQSTPVTGLSLISRGNAPVNPAELLLSERFHQFIEQMINEYDHVLIDAPPLLAVTDAVILSRYAGMTLIVARYGKTHIRELQLSVAKLEQAEQKAHGIILNDVLAEASDNYGYSYNYNYRSKEH